MSNTTFPELITAQELAKVLKLHGNTIRTWANEGKLPGIKLPNGEWRFRAGDIAKMLAVPSTLDAS